MGVLAAVATAMAFRRRALALARANAGEAVSRERTAVQSVCLLGKYNRYVLQGTSTVFHYSSFTLSQKMLIFRFLKVFNLVHYS